MSHAAEFECARCKKHFSSLKPLPKPLRFLMLPAQIVFPVFKTKEEYCDTCHRALIMPTFVLVVLALLVLSITPLRYFGIIR